MVVFHDSAQDHCLRNSRHLLLSVADAAYLPWWARIRANIKRMLLTTRWLKSFRRDAIVTSPKENTLPFASFSEENMRSAPAVSSPVHDVPPHNLANTDKPDIHMQVHRNSQEHPPHMHEHTASCMQLRTPLVPRCCVRARGNNLTIDKQTG
jgi:hypothetical protein